MRQYKVLVTGPVGAGKTTAIHSISTIKPVNTDVLSNDGKNGRKQSTVAMDYGVINIGTDKKIHLYGTPGQERFNFMWDILAARTGVGLIILLDNTRPNPIQDMGYYLNAFSKYINESKIVIGITQMDVGGNLTIEDYQNRLENSKVKPHVIAVDARVNTDVAKLIQELL
jgi:signal recognition particle receptor subunit beta